MCHLQLHNNIYPALLYYFLCDRSFIFGCIATICSFFSLRIKRVLFKYQILHLFGIYSTNPLGQPLRPYICSLIHSPPLGFTGANFCSAAKHGILLHQVVIQGGSCAWSGGLVYAPRDRKRYKFANCTVDKGVTSWLTPAGFHGRRYFTNQARTAGDRLL
jgi:hypothetical protein